MNKFNDNNNYKNLVVQFNLLNTINGGSISPDSKLIKRDGVYILSIRTPSISANNINLVLDGDRFIVFCWSKKVTGKYISRTPSFITNISVPRHGDVENVTAFYKNEELKLYMPIAIGVNTRPRRKIDIKQL